MAAPVQGNRKKGISKLDLLGDLNRGAQASLKEKERSEKVLVLSSFATLYSGAHNRRQHPTYVILW